jgi:hypothetical protein
MSDLLNNHALFIASISPSGLPPMPGEPSKFLDPFPRQSYRLRRGQGSSPTSASGGRESTGHNM